MEMIIAFKTTCEELSEVDLSSTKRWLSTYSYHLHPNDMKKPLVLLRNTHQHRANCLKEKNIKTQHIIFKSLATFSYYKMFYCI